MTADVQLELAAEPAAAVFGRDTPSFPACLPILQQLVSGGNSQAELEGVDGDPAAATLVVRVEAEPTQTPDRVQCCRALDLLLEPAATAAAAAADEACCTSGSGGSRRAATLVAVHRCSNLSGNRPRCRLHNSAAARLLARPLHTPSGVSPSTLLLLASTCHGKELAQFLGVKEVVLRDKSSSTSLGPLEQWTQAGPPAAAVACLAGTVLASVPHQVDDSKHKAVLPAGAIATALQEQQLPKTVSIPVVCSRASAAAAQPSIQQPALLRLLLDAQQAAELHKSYSVQQQQQQKLDTPELPAMLPPPPGQLPLHEELQALHVSMRHRHRSSASSVEDAKAPPEVALPAITDAPADAQQRLDVPLLVGAGSCNNYPCLGIYLKLGVACMADLVTGRCVQHTAYAWHAHADAASWPPDCRSVVSFLPPPSTQCGSGPVRVLAGWRCGNEGGSIHRACKLHRSSTFVLTDCKGVMLSGASDLFSLACMLKVLVGWCSGVVMLVPRRPLRPGRLP